MEKIKKQKSHKIKHDSFLMKTAFRAKNMIKQENETKFLPLEKIKRKIYFLTSYDQFRHTDHGE